jgi:hypothetical protein
VELDVDEKELPEVDEEPPADEPDEVEAGEEP